MFLKFCCKKLTSFCFPAAEVDVDVGVETSQKPGWEIEFEVGASTGEKTRQDLHELQDAVSWTLFLFVSLKVFYIE